jgi:hypothetical protein
MIYIFRPQNRVYSEWEWEDENEISHAYNVIDVNPIEHYLIYGDSVSHECIIRSSSHWKNIHAGVLVCATGSRTYGRKGKRLLYKCIPNDSTLPSILVPFELKNTSFSKAQVNKYVTFKLLGSEEHIGKHLVGSLTQVIGNVDLFDAYCDYSLICNDVCQPIQKFTKTVFTAIKNNKQNECIETKYSLEDRTANDIITIDPEGCKDFDDAIGIINTSDSVILSIYIANVALWLDNLQLWTTYPGRISTVYFPTKTIPMLPIALSESLCSLISGDMSKYTLAMDLEMKRTDIGQLELHKVYFKQCKIKIRRNFIYNEPALENDKLYRQIRQVVVDMQPKYPCLETIADSHDVVAFCMLVMNHQTALYMKERDIGIYRGMEVDDIDVSELPQEIRCVARTWGSEGGQYYDSTSAILHGMMNPIINIYCHATSPIRRLVDLVNQTQICATLCDGFSDISKNSALNIILNLPTINKKMKAIRKIQNGARLLYEITTRDDLCESMVGYVLDSEPIVDKFKTKFYTNIYVPMLSTVGTAITDMQLIHYTKINVGIYLFTDEATLKKKVRLMIL